MALRRMISPGMVDLPTVARWLKHSIMSEETGPCRIWTGQVRNVAGYQVPSFTVNRWAVNPRIVAWYILNDEPPPYRNLFPICRNPLCVEPRHVVSAKTPLNFYGNKGKRFQAGYDSRRNYGSHNPLRSA